MANLNVLAEFKLKIMVEVRYTAIVSQSWEPGLERNHGEAPGVSTIRLYAVKCISNSVSPHFNGPGRRWRFGGSVFYS